MKIALTLSIILPVTAALLLNASGSRASGIADRTINHLASDAEVKSTTFSWPSGNDLIIYYDRNEPVPDRIDLRWANMAGSESGVIGNIRHGEALAVSRDGEYIAYHSTGNGRMYLVKRGGTPVEIGAQYGGEHWPLAFDPTKNVLAFHADEEIGFLNVETNVYKDVYPCNYVGQAAFSKDGSHLLIQEQGERPETHLINVTTGSATRVSKDIKRFSTVQDELLGISKPGTDQATLNFYDKDGKIKRTASVPGLIHIAFVDQERGEIYAQIGTNGTASAKFARLDHSSGAPSFIDLDIAALAIPQLWP